jgi:hypothetical protein
MALEPGDSIELITEETEGTWATRQVEPDADSPCPTTLP